MTKRNYADPIVVDSVEIGPGESKVVSISLARLYDFSELSMSVKVMRGVESGPCLFLCAAIHGDEINGAEIIKRVLAHASLNKLKGTLIAIPIVNVFGFNSQSRYLPDRRDLNRCFPGSKNGSLGARIAFTLLDEIISKATHVIDFHTAALYRVNLPQIRASVGDAATRKMAEAFGAPVMLDSSVRDGSLRDAAQKRSIPALVFEGGEALRYTEDVVRVGVHGVFNVMHDIGMLESKPKRSRRKKAYAEVAAHPHHHPQHAKRKKSFFCNASHWIRAPQGGSLTIHKNIGQRVEEGELLGTISDAFGEQKVLVIAKQDGLIIGQRVMPLINRGDALFHIATFKQKISEKEGAQIDQLTDNDFA